MKKCFVIVTFLFLAFGAVLPEKSYAAGDLLKPTSFFYFAQSWKESLGMFFTFSKESKLNYLEELNNKRISELQNYGNDDARVAEMLANKYENNYKKIETLAPKAADNRQAAEKIESNNLIEQASLARVYSQVPEEAKPAILDAQINSSKNVSAILEKVLPEKAKDYAERVQAIRRTQMAEKASMVEKESGNEGGNPEDRKPKPLNAIKEGNELNPTNDSNNADGQGSQGGAQPMQPAPMQSPASQQ